jgi:hypothetical protein
MIFRLFGKFTGELCKECSIFYTHGIVRLYRQSLNAEVLTHAVAQPKDTVRALKSEEAKAFENDLLGTATIDAKGGYELKFDGDRSKYEGGPVLVVLEIPFLDPMKGPERKHETLSYAITTLQPAWERSRDQSEVIARFDHCLSERITCAILKHFDIWVISGQVVNCANPRLRAAGVKVTAMDADLISDDKLGSAVTDAGGKFKIFYRSIDFKRTFLSPLINVETLGAAGPDLYFLITASDGTPLLTETRADGQKPGRKDASNCFCVALCADTDIPDDKDAILWTGVGDSFIISTEGNRNNFDDEGYAEPTPTASSKKYAIGGVTAMTGQKPNPLDSGNPIEYRFRVSATISGNNPPAVGNHLPALPAANFTRIVGVTPGLYADVQLGSLVRTIPSLRILPVFLSIADLDAEGWVDVRKAVNRTLVAHPSYDPADLTDPNQTWKWADNDRMIGLNTSSLTAEESHSDFASLPVGDPVPVGERYLIERVAIRFEIRDQVTQAALPGDGTTLNAMVVNNDPVVIKLAVENAAGTTVVCDKFKDEDVFVAYTAYHPHLEYVSIDAAATSGAYSTSVVSAPVPFNNNPRPGFDHANNPHYMLQPRPNVTCNYAVTLSWRLLVHNGYSASSGHSTMRPFYYEV